MTRRTAVVGHRGWPVRYPDNTLVGLIAATAVTDQVEIDIRRSGDGKLVLAHDPTMIGHIVCETPWSVLSELDLGDGHKPALLDEALATLPGVRVQLEVKNRPGEPGFEPDHRIGLEVAERARPGDTVTGFNWETQAMVRRVYPDVETGIAIDEPIPIGVAIEHCLQMGHRVLVPGFAQISDPLNSELEIYPYTVNNVATARQLAEFGVAGIITDDPGLMTDALWREE